MITGIRAYFTRFVHCHTRIEELDRVINQVCTYINS
jgi:hypothetical protein